MEVSSAAKQAEQLRQNGKLYFEKEKYGAAIDAYTEAIALCPNVSVYWTNRALCHRKKNNWPKVEEDCRRAIQLDGNSYKAHYMLGVSLLQKGDISEGIKQLENALEDHGRGANPQSSYVEAIWQELSKAKYREWELASCKRSWEWQKLKESCEIALIQKQFFDEEGVDAISQESTKSNLEQIKALDRVFQKVAEADTPSEVPDHLCCKITLDIFRDPVITPSGITYERAVLLDHLEKVGKFDPTTREALQESQLIPNLAIKEAVQAFLKDHGWAYRPDSEQDW